MKDALSLSTQVASESEIRDVNVVFKMIDGKEVLVSYLSKDPWRNIEVNISHVTMFKVDFYQFFTQNVQNICQCEYNFKPWTKHYVVIFKEKQNVRVRSAFC